MDEAAYLIRYGLMGYVGRFRASPGCDGPLGRGQAVVIRTDRGVELGEVLAALDRVSAALAPAVDRQHVIRPAGAEDLDRWRRVEAIRSDRFAMCRRVLEDAGWPWDLVDVEPLLDDEATVLHYLGPHRLDASAIRARFRMTCDLEVVLEPAGADCDPAVEESAGADAGHGCGSGGGCGSCGPGGGCGSRNGPAADPANAPSGAAAKPHAGCASCGIGQLLAGRNRHQAGTPA